jgi:hypothetical protein
MTPHPGARHHERFIFKTANLPTPATSKIYEVELVAHLKTRGARSRNSSQVSLFLRLRESFGSETETSVTSDTNEGVAG